VIKDFWEEFARYTGFVKDIFNGRLDVVQRCELTYVQRWARFLGPEAKLESGRSV
jgi:hypothetical protein